MIRTVILPVGGPSGKCVGIVELLPSDIVPRGVPGFEAVTGICRIAGNLLSRTLGRGVALFCRESSPPVEAPFVVLVCLCPVGGRELNEAEPEEGAVDDFVNQLFIIAYPRQTLCFAVVLLPMTRLAKEQYGWPVFAGDRVSEDWVKRHFSDDRLLGGRGADDTDWCAQSSMYRSQNRSTVAAGTGEVGVAQQCNGFTGQSEMPTWLCALSAVIRNRDQPTKPTEHAKNETAGCSSQDRAETNFKAARVLAIGDDEHTTEWKEDDSR